MSWIGNELTTKLTELAELSKRVDWEIDTLRRNNYDSVPKWAAARVALESIAKNTCCDKCQEAALVARKALATIDN
jgi:hypothetical protein